VPQGAVSDPASVVGRVLAQPLGQGEPLTADKLAPEGVTSGGMGSIVNPGRRAMAVKGNKVLGLNGFIGPGNCVDVLVTVDDPKDKERKLTKIVLENVPVLATGGEIDRKPGKEDLSSVEVYTLEVTPDEAERLALAATHGTLHFALRNPTDKAMVLTEGVDIESTLAAFRAPPKPAAPPAPPRVAKAPPPRPSVQVIRGSTLDKVEF
jgi:pilus assembly protein CpaB